MVSGDQKRTTGSEHPFKAISIVRRFPEPVPSPLLPRLRVDSLRFLPVS